MKLLDGRELAGYIKERQAHEVRALHQDKHIFPKLAIVRTNPDPVVDSYMRLKQRYGTDILIDVDIVVVEQSKAVERIKELNADPSIYGIIVQIPLPDPSQSDEVLNAVAAEKDVDGLAAKTMFDPATPLAIIWLLAGYNIDLIGKNVVLVGYGRLVGKPLARMLKASGVDVKIVDKDTDDPTAITREADVLVCATGVANLITADKIKPDAVIVDAGVATDKNGLVGDVADDVRELPNITITPQKGGVGPLTVCALFDNVLRAARATVKE